MGQKQPYWLGQLQKHNTDVKDGTWLFFRYKTICTAWIHYKKAFNSIPHDWILKSMELSKAFQTLVTFLEASMQMWHTPLCLQHADRAILLLLSGFHFWLSSMPLTKNLNDTGQGFKITDKQINNLMYMDDSKLCRQRMDNWNISRRSHRSVTILKLLLDSKNAQKLCS